MKSACFAASIAAFIVAPLVGAWIEIGIRPTNAGQKTGRSSCRSVDCNSNNPSSITSYRVAPLVGAWIEIDMIASGLTS